MRVFAAVALSCLLGAAPAVISPDTILANAADYDGQVVTVAGVAKNVQSRTMYFGTAVSYDLCATQCVHVFDRSGAGARDGETITVTGTFHAQLRRPRGAGGWHQGGGGWHQGGGGWHQGGEARFPTQNVLIVGSPQGQP
jgi:hypothetical protein